MRIARVASRAQVGLAAPRVQVEVHLGSGLPTFSMVSTSRPHRFGIESRRSRAFRDLIARYRPNRPIRSSVLSAARFSSACLMTASLEPEIWKGVSGNQSKCRKKARPVYLTQNGTYLALRRP